MKKLSLYIFLVLMFCNLANAERVTLGFTGDTCENFHKGKNIDEKEFKDVFIVELRGFMTGYNLYMGIQDNSADNMKTLDHNSMDYAYNNIVEFCRKNPKEQVFFGIIKYINSLPN